MNRVQLRLAGLLALLLVLAAAGPMIQTAGAAAAPTVSVSNVAITAGTDSTAGGPVCSANNTGSVAVAATVATTFDTDSGPTITSTVCTACRTGAGAWNGNCGVTAIAGVNSRKTVVTQTKVYDQKVVTGSASDNNGNSNAPVFDVGTLSGIGNFGTLPDGPEGKTTITATATASERETITNTTTINFWSGGPTGPAACTGTQIGSDTVLANTPVGSQITKTSNSSSANGSYLVDLVAPTVTPGNPGFFNNPATIKQSGSELVHMQIENGSADTDWSVTVTATGPNSTELTANENGTFGSSADGIKKETNPGPFTLETECGTPVGTYNVAATVKTVDLCGAAYPDIELTGLSFEVESGGDQLVAQTAVLSQLTSGEYGIDQCFIDSVKQQAKKLIVNNTPGSVHIGTIVKAVTDLTGPCHLPDTLTGVQLTLTLPDKGLSSGFDYEITGSSPNAHIFIGDTSGGGFDLHDGTPLTEVTGVVTQNTSGRTITINLGDVSSTATIFARAHARFNATAKAGQPDADTPFKFSSSASTTQGFSGGSNYYISGNPIQEMDNLTGGLLGRAASCDADGLFTP